ncbi:stretch-activated Ca2+-permeable channel component-domain-containing protein [Infundibulicybe gibba]|nr:stretch-activated Ca2+-permeable channel component-domain-containing protein [Infundibulicybe gibba]
MLPEALLCLLGAAIVSAQTRVKLELNTFVSFNGSNAPDPPVFTIPASDTAGLTVSVALCSNDVPPRFFVTNGSAVDVPGPNGGPNVFQVPLQDGFGNWTGVFPAGGVLAVDGLGKTPFELGISGDDPIHSVLESQPFVADTTSNQAIIFSPSFGSFPLVKPTYPNYTLPAANLSFPPPPPSTPNFTLILAPTNADPPLRSLLQTGCVLRAQNSTGTIVNESIWSRSPEDGWRAQWLIDTLAPSTNYTAYVIQDSTKISGPVYFTTKSAAFACSLVHSLPYCPNVAYAVPLPPPTSGTGTYDSTTLPPTVAEPLLSGLTNFTTTLTTFACGRDWYSPLVGCDDCQRAYRRWLCAITFTRCGEPSPSSPAPSPAVPETTGLGALRPLDPQAPHGAQQVVSALALQPTNVPARSSALPPLGTAYTALLPCIERCTAVDRACPSFLGFRCPVPRFNAAASYGVGFVDGFSGTEGAGATGEAQDRWGNVWCNMA